MNSKLYVWNLSFNTENIDLEKLFAESGEVALVDIKKDKRTGRNQGFGFVEMKNPEEASNAIERLNGSDFKGSKIKVSISKEKSSKEPAGE